MSKKFKRSKDDKLVAGVLGGVAKYFSLDSTIVRIVWLLTLGFTGFIPGIIIYMTAVIIFPQEGKRKIKLEKRLANKLSNVLR